MKRKISSSKRFIEEEALINLTPLLDVVFVMLIMFIIVAPLLEIDQIELAKAGSNAKEITSIEEQKRHILVHIKKDNSILFNKQAVSKETLKKLLKDNKDRFPKEIPMLINDKQAYFGTYQEVKNALEEAGFKEMDIVLTP